jgi:hypothetical protein
MGNIPIEIISNPVLSLEEITDPTSSEYNPLITKLIKDEYGSIDVYMKSNNFKEEVRRCKESKIRKK